MSTPVVAPDSRTPVPASTISNRQRFLWCAVGAALPMLIRLSQQNDVVGAVRQLHVSGLVDLIFPAVIAILAAGIMALIFREETNIYQLVILGASAPALIASWSSYNSAQANLAALQEARQLQILNAPAGSSTPQAQSYVEEPAFSLLPTVHAADNASQIKPFPHYAPGTFAKLSASVTGASTTTHDYFVIVESYAAADQALQHVASVQSRVPGREVDVFRSPDGYAPVVYCVVVSPNLTFGDASSLLRQVNGAGFSTSYIWTFGLALRPPSGK